MKIAFVINQVQYSIPLGIAYCAAVLKNRGFDCQVFEISHNEERAQAELCAYSPDVIGFSLYSGTHQGLIRLSERLKGRLKFIGIFGGPHATFFPEIIQDSGVDAVCLGEGELALAEFMEQYREKGAIPTDIANFWIKDGNKIFKNKVRPLISRLDSLPFPDRMIFIKKYPIFNLHGIKHFLAHRGCPYHCTFCFNHAFNRIYGISGRDCYHSRSPENICEEIELERGRMKLDMISFVDDCFSLDREWTMDFCKVYRERVNLPFQINTRVENLDADRIAALASANCWLIHIGVESGNEDYRKKVLKRGMSNQLLISTIKLCRQAGIHILTENMIGLPSEGYDGAINTLKLNFEAAPDFSAASFFTPYPKLELTRFAVEEGVYQDEVGELPEDYMHRTLLQFDSPSEKRRIINLRSFFNLSVRYPRLWPIFNFLTKLPPNPLFRIIGDIADGFFLWKILPYRISLKDFFLLVWQYITSYRKIMGRGVSN